MKKYRWRLSFYARIKRLVVKAAKRRGIDPATILEDLVREKFNPFGHTDVEDSISYVADLRKQNRLHRDKVFWPSSSEDGNDLRHRARLSRLRKNSIIGQ